VQKEPTGCIIYFQSISIINLYMYRAGLLLILRRFVCSSGITNHCGCIFTARWRALASSFSRFLDHTQRRTTINRTPLDEWSARRRDLYPTTHNTHNRKTSMPPLEFEPTISVGERPKTYSL